MRLDRRPILMTLLLLAGTARNLAGWSPAPDDPKPADAPDAFEFWIGGMLGSHQFTWDDKVLRVEKNAAQPSDRVVAEIRPTAAQWRAFRDEMDRIKVWDWAARYDNPHVLDGAAWRLKLAWGDQQVRTAGRNGYPGDGDPTRQGPDPLPTARFRSLLRALEILTDVKLQ